MSQSGGEVSRGEFDAIREQGNLGYAAEQFGDIIRQVLPCPVAHSPTHRSRRPWRLVCDEHDHGTMHPQRLGGQTRGGLEPISAAGLDVHRAGEGEHLTCKGIEGHEVLRLQAVAVPAGFEQNSAECRLSAAAGPAQDNGATVEVERVPVQEQEARIPGREEAAEEK
jgi:hypothetical protein